MGKKKRRPRAEYSTAEENFEAGRDELEQIDPADEPSIAGQGGLNRRPLKSVELEKVVAPRGGEPEDDFVSRCMSEEKDSFPDREQRLAVCFEKWRSKEKDHAAADLVDQLRKAVTQLGAIVVARARNDGRKS